MRLRTKLLTARKGVTPQTISYVMRLASEGGEHAHVCSSFLRNAVLLLLNWSLDQLLLHSLYFLIAFLDIVFHIQKSWPRAGPQLKVG